jgi:hypothetical protein
MPNPFAAVTAGLAAACLGAAVYQLAMTVRRLEKRLEEQQALPEPAPPPARHTRAYFGGLYPEAHTSQPPFATVMGGGWVVGAGLLAAISVVVSLFAATPKAQLPPAHDPELARLESRVDSLASSLGLLRDSVHLAAGGSSSPRSAAPAARNLARATPSQPSRLEPAPLPPPPPTLDSISHTTRATP